MAAFPDRCPAVSSGGRPASPARWRAVGRGRKSPSARCRPRLLAELESVRGKRAKNDDRKRADTGYAAAFHRAGLDLAATESAEAGKWLAERSQPVELAGYHDDWAYVRRNSGPGAADWRRLVAAARSRPRPLRDALRAVVGAKDEAAIIEFRRLANDGASAATQTAPSLVLLALQLRNGALDPERAASVLRGAVARYPADFWSHFQLSVVFGADFGETGLEPYLARICVYEAIRFGPCAKLQGSQKRPRVALCCSSSWSARI